MVYLKLSRREIAAVSGANRWGDLLLFGIELPPMSGS